MAEKPDVVAFKTDAWKSPDFVRGYAGLVEANVSANRLKNAVEADLIERWLTGTDVIDVGIGTGRASIPLARNGIKVTGIDSSQAMLDRARLDAAPVQLDLRLGDLTKLPADDESFDSLIALNVAVHFAHWQQYLLEWKRVVRQGGRMIFDIHGMDHVQVVANLIGTPIETLLAPEAEPIAFVARLRWRELVAFCNANDLQVEAIIPYALFFGNGQLTFQLNGGLARGTQLDRLLTTMTVDEQLFEFGRFMEHELIGRLAPEATGRMMVVIKNAANRDANERFAERNEKLNAVFAAGPSFAKLAPYLALEPAAWKAEAARHLAYEPNFVFAFMLMSAMPASWFTEELLDEAFGAEIGSHFRRMHQLLELDRAVEDLGVRWYEGQTAMYRGVSLGAVARYAVTENLLVPSAKFRADALK